MNYIVHVWKTRAKKTPWTWQLKSRNGKIVANAAETYDDKTGARRAGVKIGMALQCRVTVEDATDPQGFTVAFKPPERVPGVPVVTALPGRPGRTNREAASGVTVPQESFTAGDANDPSAD